MIIIKCLLILVFILVLDCDELMIGEEYNPKKELAKLELMFLEDELSRLKFFRGVRGLNITKPKHKILKNQISTIFITLKGIIMSFLDKLKEGFDDAVNQFKKLKNKNLMEGTLAACALVANANGIIKPEEKRKVIGYIQRNDALSVYETSDVIKSFEKYIESFQFDLEIGKGECLKAVSKIKDKNEAQLLVRVCCSIGAADGDFDNDEKQVVREVCNTLGLETSQFGL